MPAAVGRRHRYEAFFVQILRPVSSTESESLYTPARSRCLPWRVGTPSDQPRRAPAASVPRAAFIRTGADLFIQWVREWPEGHSLPVVAMGLIPHIYRRADFPHRATPLRLPLNRGAGSCHLMARWRSRQFNNPFLAMCWLRSRLLSVFQIRLYFIQRMRHRIHLSSFWNKLCPVAKGGP